MNKIYINGRFLSQKITGVQRFAFEICNELIKLRNDIVFLIPHSVDTKSIPQNFNFLIIGKKSGLYWEQIELLSFLKKEGDPILINLCNRAPIFYKNNFVVLHDVTFRRYPKSVSFSFGLFYRLMLPSLVRGSKWIITVSDFSKGEILYFYPKCKDKISVIYNAVDSKFSFTNQMKNEGDYLLAVSSDFPHKNFERLIEAFLLLDSSKIKLKIVGSKGILADKYKDNECVEFIGRVNDEELIELYRNALVFIFPSLYEGFGIPPLEAQACGCPVLSSNFSAMPEVLGDSVIYFDPLNIDDISHSIQKIIDDRDVVYALKAKGFDNINRFSWEISASKLSNIIDKQMGMMK